MPHKQFLLLFQFELRNYFGFSITRLYSPKKKFTLKGFIENNWAKLFELFIDRRDLPVIQIYIILSVLLRDVEQKSSNHTLANK